MKKVGLLTFHDEHNYGAFLQTFALSEYIKSVGFEVEIIDLRIKDSFRYSLIVKLLFPILRYFLFERARQKYLKRTNRIYYTSQELIKNPPQCDIYVLGSDQVWNKDITGDLKYSFFFDFVPDTKPRFSYASSFGVGKWEFKVVETGIVSELLKKFTSVAVREKSAIDLCKDNCGVDAVLVVDPTLLISDYSKLIGKVRINGKGIVSFKFTKGDDFYDFLRKIKRITNQDVTILNKTVPVKQLRNIPLPTIKKWVKSIAEADLVITDSYHALCFSIIFRKQFIVLPANEKNFNRLSELLSDLGIENRIFYSYEEVLSDHRWKDKINYEKVNEKLAVKVNQSKLFIQNQLNTV